MNRDIYKLYREFNKIRKLGWIKSMRHGTGGIGYTFETLLGKSEENRSLPDYRSIEIKTMRSFTRGEITLFSLVPDNSIEATDNLLSTLGYPSKYDKNIKVLNKAVNAVSFTSVGYFKRMKLIINNDLKRIELLAVDHTNRKLNLDVFWSFDSIYERLHTKLSYLAIVKANSKRIKSEEYFYYHHIDFYKLKSFDSFMKLLQNGEIIVTFKIGIFKRGRNVGKLHNRGTNFSINICNIEKLFEKIQLSCVAASKTCEH